MKELPILFSTEMVKAHLESRKTNTRRLRGLDKVNVDPSDWVAPVFGKLNQDGPLYANFIHRLDPTLAEAVVCPYGYVGDLLYVREKFAYYSESVDPEAQFEYYATLLEDPSFHEVRKAYKDNGLLTGWKPSIHMPKKAARIWLQIENIGIERLQDISEEDAKDEGSIKVMACSGGGYKYPHFSGYEDSQASHKIGFERIWKQINSTESWNLNPWVWVVKYKVLSTTGMEFFK